MVKRTVEGISMWRRIVDSIVDDINRGALAPGGRLPSAPAIATRFGVNRLTVLRALSHLENEGVVSMEQGRGTFVSHAPINYHFENRKYFEENILENRKKPSRKLISIEQADASAAVCAALGLRDRERVVVVTTLSEADGVPISYGPSYFPERLLPNIGRAFEKAARGADAVLSTSAVLKKLGVTDYHRKSVRMRSRPPTTIEVERLKIPTTEHVLQTDVINVDAEERLISFGQTAYAASRVEFVFGS
ncbi:phosphonate metabolism transcriptional regulator PhnF [Bradyrhizobium pachyrhizi]|uniref:phosphonate metabolism transcriptional regulator PhnF n=1 Tax=Bradyrhizobium pachyrhizi TaxID=280333 RepID=UPI00067D10A5|nr:phosphonate metabolism transcriptional regulator PhnF [Bradyrhizobium pachyrhizi]